MSDTVTSPGLRTLVADLPADLRKYAVELNARAFLPDSGEDAEGYLKSLARNGAA